MSSFTSKQPLMLKVWYKSLMFSKRAVTIFAAAVVTALALGTLSACEPKGKAVGDTGRAGDIIHDGVDINDIHLLVIGSKSEALDDELLRQCKMYGISAAYVSVSDINNPNEAAQQAIRSASEQPVSMIFINSLDVTKLDSNSQVSKKSKESAVNKSGESKAWISALQYARYAGVPVAIVNPIKAPKDETLYAATLHMNDVANGIIYETDSSNHNEHSDSKNTKLYPERSSLLSIVRAIIDNTPHSREVIVNDK